MASPRIRRSPTPPEARDQRQDVRSYFSISFAALLAFYWFHNMLRNISYNSFLLTSANLSKSSRVLSFLHMIQLPSTKTVWTLLRSLTSHNLRLCSTVYLSPLALPGWWVHMFLLLAFASFLDTLLLPFDTIFDMLSNLHNFVSCSQLLSCFLHLISGFWKPKLRYGF